MLTEVLHVDATSPDPSALRRAATVLREGGLVAFPTETVYGLGANALNPEAALKMRNSLIHGGLTYTFEKRLALHQLVPKLRRAVEDELADRLGATAVLRISEEVGRGTMTRNIQYPCEYRTAFPSEAFPSDAPTMRDVDEYREAFRRGEQHAKIITFIDGAPRW